MMYLLDDVEYSTVVLREKHDDIVAGLQTEIESLKKDATQMFAALEQSGSSNRLPDDLIERWRGK